MYGNGSPAAKISVMKIQVALALEFPCEASILVNLLDVQEQDEGGRALEFVFPKSRSKVNILPTTWLYNSSAQDELPCSSICIPLRHVYARRNQWLYR